MIHEWQPNSRATQRGFWRNPGEQRKFGFKTHKDDKGGEWCYSRKKEEVEVEVEVDHKEIEKKKNSGRNNRRDKVARSIISSGMIYWSYHPGRDVDWA
jgi:hypothetical protein